MALILSSVAALAATQKPAPRYREWLERDVAYIITQEEKDAFLRLGSDQERDKFMERFWELRNPTPGAPTNPFKEEHYRRLTYANQFFGHESGTEGWRTDRGRVYITLGAPQQRAPYLGYGKLRPMEIWFYQNSHPALPPFFYVVFYRRDSTGDFRLYSPYMDGPEKLVTTDPGSRVKSLKVIDEQAGREVARTALSLLPDEPVDFDTARSSLQSDIVLATVRNLANHPLTKEQLARRRQILESVTHRVIVPGEFLGFMAAPLRDAEGNTFLHYAARESRPEDFTLSKTKEGQYYYSLDVTTRVLGADNKLIFTREKALSRYVDAGEVERIKDKSFAYESILPLPPGKYKLEIVLSDRLKHTGFRTEKEVEIPKVASDALTLSAIVPFSEAEAASSAGALPFTVAGVRFSPIVGQPFDLTRGEDLKFFYQIWRPATDAASSLGKKLVVEYAYGRPGGGGSKSIRDEVAAEQFDPAGSMVNGKKISLGDLPSGNYRLVVTVSDPDTQKKAYASLNFRVLENFSRPLTWFAHEEDSREALRTASLDHERALCYSAAGDDVRAMEWLRKAVQKNPRNHEAISKLVDLYYGRGKFAEIAALQKQANAGPGLEERTLLRIADSLERTGQITAAVGLLESAVAGKSATGPLYLALASYYQRLGQVEKSSEMQQKAKSLMRTAAQPI